MKRERRRGIVSIPGMAGIILLAASGLSQAAQDGRDQIEVTLDQAKLVKLPAGAETIVIGNPSIADVSVQRNGVMVITGRSTGRTNFIALDSGGNIISESMVAVTIPTLGRVVVQRGLDRASYDCAPLCSPAVSLGDDEKHFGRTVDQASRRDGMANGSGASAGPAAAQQQRR